MNELKQQVQENLARERDIISLKATITAIASALTDAGVETTVTFRTGKTRRRGKPVRSARAASARGARRRTGRVKRDGTYDEADLAGEGEVMAYDGASGRYSLMDEDDPDGGDDDGFEQDERLALIRDVMEGRSVR